MISIQYNAKDEAATAALGTALAEALPDGAVVALCGTLGAGKTRLVQAVAAAVGIDRRTVVSPTFVLVQEYHGRRTLYHVDAFRLRDEDEYRQLGPDELYESNGIVLIEWADRVEGELPGERLQVNIEVTGATARRFEIEARGARFEPVVRRLEELLPSA